MPNLSTYQRQLSAPVEECQRIATNGRAALLFLTMNEPPAVPNVSVWDGFVSAGTGTHQRYMYELETSVAPATVEDHTGGTASGTSPIIGNSNLTADADDIVLAFILSGNPGAGEPAFVLFPPLQQAVLRDSLDDTDKYRYSSIDPSLPTSKAVPTFGVIGSDFGIGQAVLIRGGIRGPNVSSQETGSTPSLAITTTVDQSLIIACVSYQGSVANPAITLPPGWTTIREDSVSVGGVHATQHLMWRLGVDNGDTITCDPTIDNHDGSSTTSFFLVEITSLDAISPTSIWQQWILMKDVSGTFTPGEILVLTP